MKRLIAVSAVVLVIGIGCTRTRPQDPADGNLELILPESVAAPKHAPDRVSKLTVNEKDFTEPRGTAKDGIVNRALKVDATKGTAHIEYSFWPNTYTNIVRTKVVKIEKDKTVKADLTKEDTDNPDKIKPIYVPTPPEVVTEMCKWAKVGDNDIVYDIGCGEGLMVLQAVKDFNAKKGVGIDIDEGLVGKAREHAKKQKLESKVEFRAADALQIKEYSEATVVLLYVGDFLGEKLSPVLKSTLRPGSRVVSHRFLLGDWKADETKKITAKNNYGDPEPYELLIWYIK